VGDYDEQLKRYCIMKAIRQQEEEEMEMFFFSDEEDEGESANVLPFLLVVGAVLWVIDKIDKEVRAFLSIPWVSQYVKPYLTWGNLFVVLLVWLFIRYMRGRNK